MPGFLDPNLRCDTAEPVSEEILELEHEICMNSCAYIMLHAIMGQQSSKSSVESLNLEETESRQALSESECQWCATAVSSRSGMGLGQM